MINQENKAFSLRELLASDKYIIPRYQRNYAWGKAEISQLIKDVVDFFKDNSDKNYYVGSLVCFKRENGDYELIDGQQRHTTISLINAVLKNWHSLNEKNDKIENVISETNLKFDSRKNVQRFLEELYQTQDFEGYIEKSNISGIQNFKDAIQSIRECFSETEEFTNKKFEVKEFADKFYNKVKFFRVEVPQDTDLNHYFEIMNNRGEQLEKHEIVKADLMSKIKNENLTIEKQEQEVFATIWDACSDMSNYIYFNFKKETRESLFSNGSFNLETFEDLKRKINTKSNDVESTLSQILGNVNYELSKDFSQEEKMIKEKYKSVIDFPNFLLQVLKLDFDVSLDDKNLLKAFECEIDSKIFIHKLLNYRVIFDKYIIKQDLSDNDEEKQNWSIRTINSTNEGVEKTYKESDDELIKLQTMLYYSNPSNSNNNWIQKIFKEKYFEDELTMFSENVFSEIAKPRFDDKNLAYPDITAYNLYFIDFLLWKTYKEKVQGKTDFEKESLEYKISENSSFFNNFKFRQLNSKEHLLPQSKVTESQKEVLNSLGNLCLISTSQNSSANDNHPTYKKNQYYKKDNPSLKLMIMFESFENDKWETEQIRKHQLEIQTLIESF
jgi:hypothetical protein